MHPHDHPAHRNTGGRQHSKSGKSSGESEGSPDEVLVAGPRKKPGVLNDNLQRQRSLSSSAENREQAKKPTQNIRKERARKLKGSENNAVYHFCPQCM